MKNDLTMFEQKVLDAARNLPGTFTPTTLGLKLGYEHHQAASRVAPALRRLTDRHDLIREQFAHNRVTYRVNPLNL